MYGARLTERGHFERKIASTTHLTSNTRRNVSGDKKFGLKFLVLFIEKIKLSCLLYLNIYGQKVAVLSEHSLKFHI